VLQLGGRGRSQGFRRLARPGAAGAVAALVALTVAGCGWSWGEESSADTSPDPTFIEAGTLTVCTSIPYEPFEFERGDKPVGFDIDMANEVAKRLDVRADIVNTDFDVIESGEALNDGECDVAIAAITINGERARVMDFSSPYFSAGQAMVVRSDSGIESLGDLSGLRIGVQEGTTGEFYVTDNAPPDAEIVPLANAGEVDEALDSGDVEAGIYDNTVVGDVIARYPELEVATLFNTGEQYGMAVKKNSNVDLLRVINDVLADLQASGRYDTIYNRWFRGPQDQ
jgi:polar amino acid transport system substrate-binding protein